MRITHFVVSLALLCFFGFGLPVPAVAEEIPRHVDEACRANLDRVKYWQRVALEEYPEAEREALLERSYHLFGVWFPDDQRCGVVNLKKVEGYREGMSRKELINLVLTPYREAGFNVRGRLSPDGAYVQLIMDDSSIGT